MGWISLWLLFVTLTTSSAYNYRGHPFFDYRYDGFDGYNRRIEYDPTLAYTTDRIQERSAERTNERPAQRMNERSISLTGGLHEIQRVQDKERRRVSTLVEETVPRSENGSYKIVNSPLKYPTISTRRGSVEDKTSDSVVFPGKTSADVFVPEIPKECEEIGICETIPNYPHDVVDKIIAKLGDKIDRLHIDELDQPEIAQRIGPDDAEIDLCNYRETIIKPQAAKGKNGEWFVILNSKKTPLQGYRVELCMSKDQNCAENIAFFFEGYTAKCKQKYVQRMMTAVNVQSEEAIFDMPFRVPSCCSCVAMHTTRK